MFTLKKNHSFRLQIYNNKMTDIVIFKKDKKMGRNKTSHLYANIPNRIPKGAIFVSYTKITKLLKKKNDTRNKP